MWLFGLLLVEASYNLHNIALCSCDIHSLLEIVVLLKFFINNVIKNILSAYKIFANHHNRHNQIVQDQYNRIVLSDTLFEIALDFFAFWKILNGSIY